MITIYRIQDEVGRGPFRPGFSKEWLDKLKPSVHELPPWPIQFPKVAFDIQMFHLVYCGCACASPEQLRRWFTQAEMRRLRKWGYDCVTMEVEKILDQSDVQLVFQRSKPLRELVTPFDLYPK